MATAAVHLLQLHMYNERSTGIGQLISSYLEKKLDLQDNAVHLLFTANRWELQPKMIKLLEAGVTLVVDRYSFSGVAFSSAKNGVDLQWCKQPEVGLPKPDLVMYLNIPSSVAATRGQFGEERYEKEEFQKKVANVYEVLKEDNWKELDANKSVEDLQREIFNITTSVVDESGLVSSESIGKLWTEQD
ncbi:putative thymidylate kinase [Apostichopus japonicus]|uniref:dTMP kinase n=1 Tax=Stichopus japonicus TaxID=307972 RepID=A0A2G8KKU7_STIJA|nr:putative thymidylate kinase [Apostichopus japonicus]